MWEPLTREESDTIIRRAVAILNDPSKDEVVRWQAEREMIYQLDTIDWEDTIRKQARIEERKEMVLNMLAAELPIETIAGISKLPVETIREWAQNE